MNPRISRHRAKQPTTPHTPHHFLCTAGVGNIYNTDGARERALMQSDHTTMHLLYILPNTTNGDFAGGPVAGMF